MIKLKSKQTSLKKYTNQAKLIYFSLVLREREEKKNISHLIGACNNNAHMVIKFDNKPKIPSSVALEPAARVSGSPKTKSGSGGSETLLHCVIPSVILLIFLTKLRQESQEKLLSNTGNY